MTYFILDNIKNLYIGMVKADQARQQFAIEYNNVRADVFFFIDSEPFKLAFGIIGKGLYIELSITRGFKIELPLDTKTYYDIVEGFEINAAMNGPFKPHYFLNHINSRIPQTIKATNHATPASLARYHSSVEESEKYYFIGFKDNTKSGNHVTPQNLEKTLALMGEQAYKLCFQHNLSTCWSADPNCDNFSKWRTLINQAGI